MPSEEEEIARLQAERKAALASEKYAGYDTVIADEEEAEEDDEPPVRCARLRRSAFSPFPPAIARTNPMPFGTTRL